MKVREDMPVGTVITNLVAHDADLPASGGEVTYKIVKGMYLCYTCVIGAIGRYHSELDNANQPSNIFGVAQLQTQTNDFLNVMGSRVQDMYFQMALSHIFKYNCD